MIDQIVDGFFDLTAIDAIHLSERLDVPVDTVIHMVKMAHRETFAETSKFWLLEKDGPDEKRQPIQAVKTVRQVMGIPLKNSKAIIDGHAEIRLDGIDEITRKDLKFQLEGYGYRIVASEGKRPYHP